MLRHLPVLSRLRSQLFRRIVLFILVCVSLFSPLSASASDQFAASLTLDYDYNLSGRPTITQHVSLTNRLSDTYAASYQFTVTGDPPADLSGRDALGPLKITTTAQPEGSTLVTVNFNEQVVGKGQTLNFSLTYTGPTASHRGQVWEVVIPQLSNSDMFETYTVNLTVPDTFGDPAYISPHPQSTSERRYVFTQAELSRSHIVAAFGHLQSFSFTLDYYLTNLSSRAQLQSITLPPDTPYQNLYYSSLSPRPQSVTVDADGNWIAAISVPPRQTVKVTATGSAHVQPFPSYTQVQPTPQQLAAYLLPTAHWPVTDPQIVKLAQTYSTPQAIYDFVVSYLSYDTARVTSGNSTRRGALAALADPHHSICTDFTDLFITIARAAGIPAREINGYAFTTHPELNPRDLYPDLLHAWPQYWDSGQHTWVSVDPTWGNTAGTDYFTQFDFDHLAFVIHGTSSQLPSSAGQFAPDATTQTVFVELSPYQEFPASQPEFTWTKPWQFFPLLKSRSRLTVTNPLGQALYQLPVTFTPQNLNLSSPPSDTITQLPPFASVTLPVEISDQFLPDFSPKYLTVSVADRTLTYNVPVNLFLVWHAGFALIATAALVGLAFFASQAWSLYLHRRRRRDPLRGQSQTPQKPRL